LSAEENDGLHQPLQGQNARHDRVSGKMAGQVKLVRRDPLCGPDFLSSFQFLQAVDHHKGERVRDTAKQIFPSIPVEPGSVFSYFDVMFAS
jgi:hypothetical protein